MCYEVLRHLLAILARAVLRRHIGGCLQEAPINRGVIVFYPHHERVINNEQHSFIGRCGWCLQPRGGGGRALAGLDRGKLAVAWQR